MRWPFQFIATLKANWQKQPTAWHRCIARHLRLLNPGWMLLLLVTAGCAGRAGDITAYPAQQQAAPGFIQAGPPSAGSPGAAALTGYEHLPDP